MSAHLAKSKDQFSCFVTKSFLMKTAPVAAVVVSVAVLILASLGAGSTPTHTILQTINFTRRVLTPTPAEAAHDLRFFTTAVKTDSEGKIITGPNNDQTKNFVGAESAGERGGIQRFTKIMFGANYFDGRPDPGTRIDPNNPIVKSGGQFWPFVPQPFRSLPSSLAITPDGKKLYVTLPGKENFPDWRLAVVDVLTQKLLRWVDLRPPGNSKGTRPVGAQVAPINTGIYPNPYVVVLNEYGNFGSVIDAAADVVIGEFETDFYGQDLVFDKTGTRLYITDRFNDQVRAFRIDKGPMFTQIAVIPTGTTDLERSNPRDLDISADGRFLYVGNTLGHTVAVIQIEGDANTLVQNLPVGGLTTDVKIAGRWGIVCGQESNTVLNKPETGHGLPTKKNGVPIRNNGQPLGYTPVMTDGTKATTFDDIGTELNVFDTQNNTFVYRYVDTGRDNSMLVTEGQVVDLKDHVAAQKIIKGSGPEQMFFRGDLLFVSMLHTDNVEVFRVNQNPSDPSQILTEVGLQLTGGITPQGIGVTPDGKTVFVANMQTEDISILQVDANGNLTKKGTITVGVTNKTPDPRTGNNGSNLFATGEEIGLRWFFTSSYADDAQKSCGNCHWQSRHDGCNWNVGANAVGGVKVCPQNKDLSDNWPQWFEGLNNDMTAYASACNGELIVADRRTALFPQQLLTDRLKARDEFVLQKTAQNSTAIGRPELNGKAFKVGYYDMAFLQILWTQNETRRLPNPLTQFPSSEQSAKIQRGKFLFTAKFAEGGAGCADCHHNGNKNTNGSLDKTFQDYNIHEPGVIAETTVDGDGPFLRLTNDYFFQAFGPSQDEGSRQNISSRNTKHLRTFWDSVPRWLHHGLAHTVHEILLPPDSQWLTEGERGFNFRLVRTDSTRRVAHGCLDKPCPVLPTEVPITIADSTDPGNCSKLGGDGKGRICVSIDPPTPLFDQNGKPLQTNAYPDGRLLIDRLGTNKVVPLIVNRQLNPALATNKIKLIKDTHGATSQLSQDDVDALTLYLKSLQ